MVLIFTLSGSKMPKCVKIWNKLEKCWRSSDFPGGSEFTRASEGPQNGGKMTGMDVLEFRDINGPDPMPKYGAIWSIGSRGGISPPPGLFRVN